MKKFEVRNLKSEVMGFVNAENIEEAHKIANQEFQDYLTLVECAEIEHGARQ